MNLLLYSAAAVLAGFAGRIYFHNVILPYYRVKRDARKHTS